MRKNFLFLLQGASREEACDMMARAGIDALCAQIPDDTVVRRVRNIWKEEARMKNWNEQEIRGDFPIFGRSGPLIYLDNAATAQRPACVLEAERSFYENSNANPLRGLYELGMDATQRYENARKTVCRFLNAACPEEIIFTRNTTEALNLGRLQLCAVEASARR